MATIFVHGYNMDLAGGDNPERQYRYWRRFTPDPDIIAQFAWQSTPPGGILGAWRSGSWNTYDWAWGEALHAAQRLADIIRRFPEVDIVCHSLGSRVAYEAMATVPWRVRKILTMDGADSTAHARKCMQTAYALGGTPEVHCILSKQDNVLKYLGQVFTPKLGLQRIVGYHGIKKPWPDGWYEHDITEHGDGEGLGDHSVVFEDPRFWPRWREILES